MSLPLMCECASGAVAHSNECAVIDVCASNEVITRTLINDLFVEVITRTLRVCDLFVEVICASNEVITMRSLLAQMTSTNR